MGTVTGNEFRTFADVQIEATTHGAPVEAASCRALWAKVLLTGLLDALREYSGEYEPTHKRVARARARSWLGSPDFRAVCHLAGIEDSDDVLRAVERGPQGVVDRIKRFGEPERALSE